MCVSICLFKFEFFKNALLHSEHATCLPSILQSCKMTMLQPTVQPAITSDVQLMHVKVRIKDLVGVVCEMCTRVASGALVANQPTSFTLGK